MLKKTGEGKLLLQVVFYDGSIWTPTNLETLKIIDGIFISEDHYRPKPHFMGRDMFFSAIKKVHKGRKPEEVEKDPEYEKKYNKKLL